jgi:hypothetical protein
MTGAALPFENERAKLPGAEAVDVGLFGSLPVAISMNR